MRSVLYLGLLCFDENSVAQSFIIEENLDERKAHPGKGESQAACKRHFQP